MKGYKTQIVCSGEGITKDAAIEDLIDDLFNTKQYVEFGGGDDSLKFTEVEIEEE